MALLLILLASASPIRFTGSVGLTSSTELPSGDTLQQPYSHTTFNLSPCLSLYGVPLSTDLLISTMENSRRQSLNRFRFSMNPQQTLHHQLAAPKYRQFLPTLELGRFNPAYSPLTLSGTSVAGFGVEYQLWKLHLAGALGSTSRAVSGTDTTDAVYARRLKSLRAGLGRKDATHYYITLLHAADDPNSISRNWRLYDAETVETTTPQENYLLGMEFNLCLLEDALRLESEICGSELIRDNRLKLYDHKSVPNWLERLLQIRLSSQFDFACRLRPVLNLFSTRLYGEFSLVGPGYRSLGATALRSDNQSYRLGVERDLFDQAISLSAAFARERDNLIGQKLFTTTFTELTVNLNLALPSLPYASLTYSPFWQANQSLASSSQSFSTTISHSFSTGTISHSPQLSVSWQNYGSRDTLTDSCSSLVFGISHQLGFDFPLTMAIGSQAQRNTCSDSATTLLTFNLTPSYTLFGSWTNVLAVTGSLGGSARRMDIALNSSLPVGRICEANIGIARSLYADAATRFRLWRINGTLSRSW